MDENRLRELMEASRADAVEQGLSAAEALELRELLANDPLLAADFQRIQAWDAQLSAAFAEEIPVPTGLAQRLRAAVDQELAPAPAKETAEPLPSPAVQATGLGRRWALGVLATAAALLVSFGVWNYATQPLVVHQQQLVQEVSKLGELQWNQDLSLVPRERFTNQVRGPLYGWAHVATRLDPEAVAFSLARPGAPRAVVVAMHAPNVESDLPSAPDFVPHSPTSGLAIGVWQQSPYVYALVVEGSAARYQAFLTGRGRTLAFNSRN
jgi:hypothetical protein